MEEPEDTREAAVRRVKAKRSFRSHAAIYAVVNVMLVAIWALSGGGYFWPIWSIVFWGLGVVFNGWGVYFEGRPITEDEIRREMDGRKK